MTLRLRTFGSVNLARNGEPLTGAAGQRRFLAVLTVLAAAGERGISRDKLLALLWPEGDPEKTRHALTQSLYHIRKALDVERIVLGGSGAILRLDPAIISSDVSDFQRAVAEQRFGDAESLYAGPFLDGFHLGGTSEFEYFISAERDRYARQYSLALVALADAAANSKDLSAELHWRERLVDHEPLDGTAVAKYMRASVLAGDSAAALQSAQRYTTRMRDELDLPPDRVVVDLVAELRAQAKSKSRLLRISSEHAVPTPTTLSSVAATTVNAAYAETRTLPRVRHVGWIVAGVVAAVLGVIAPLAVSRAFGRSDVPRERVVMIAPFRVASTEPASAYMREGFLDLLAARLVEPNGARAIDPDRVLRAWRAAGLGADGASSSDAARVARGVGAGEVLIGDVASSPDGVDVTIRASIVDAATAEVKTQVEVSGPPDSLMALTDQLVNGLILGEAGLAGRQPPRVAPQALRAFLAGRAAYRRDDYYGAMRAYELALAREPGFAAAALGLAISADHVNAGAQHDRGLAIALAREADLPADDRAYLRAFAGPRYPEPSSAAESMAAWQEAVRVAPDRPEAWHALGESLYYDAEVLGLSDGPQRAAQAFRRALELDSSFAPSRRMLTLLLARASDTTGLRALRDAARTDVEDSMSVFVRWRAANALGDARELARVRRAFAAAPNAALRSIAMTSQFDGVSIDDGDRALDILRGRPLSDAEEIDVALADHSRALNSGDAALALAITTELGRQQPALHPQLRLRVLDGLYADADRSAAWSAVVDLQRLVETTKPATRADSAVRLADICVLGQWRLVARDTAGARAAVAALRAGAVARFPVPVGASPMACAELIDVSLAVQEHGAGAAQRLAHLDSLMLGGPAAGDAIRYANLMIARHYQALGDPVHALAALRRRSYMRGWPRYRAAGLQMQIDLAMQVGDTAGAEAAHQRLLATRRPPLRGKPTAPFVARLRSWSRLLVY